MEEKGCHGLPPAPQPPLWGEGGPAGTGLLKVLTCKHLPRRQPEGSGSKGQAAEGREALLDKHPPSFPWSQLQGLAARPLQGSLDRCGGTCPSAPHPPPFSREPVAASNSFENALYLRGRESLCTLECYRTEIFASQGYKIFLNTPLPSTHTQNVLGGGAPSVVELKPDHLLVQPSQCASWLPTYRTGNPSPIHPGHSRKGHSNQTTGEAGEPAAGEHVPCRGIHDDWQPPAHPPPIDKASEGPVTYPR